MYLANILWLICCLDDNLTTVSYLRTVFHGLAVYLSAIVCERYVCTLCAALFFFLWPHMCFGNRSSSLTTAEYHKAAKRGLHNVHSTYSGYIDSEPISNCPEMMWHLVADSWVLRRESKLI